MFTNVEGDWDEVMAVIKACVDQVSHAAPRVSVVVKIDVRNDDPGGRLASKVESIERRLQALPDREGATGAVREGCSLDRRAVPWTVGPFLGPHRPFLGPRRPFLGPSGPFLGPSGRSLDRRGRSLDRAGRTATDSAIRDELCTRRGHN